jgi:hypothetical protein
MCICLRVKYRYSCQILMKFSKNIQTYNFTKNLSSGSHVIPCGQMNGQTDKYDEANSFFLQFYELA